MAALWKPTNFQDFEQLSHAREQLHQAIQIVAAVGRTYKPKVKDDQYANFQWNIRREMLQGQVVEGDVEISAALDLKTLSIHLLNATSETISSFELDGKTQKQSLIWLEEQLLKLGLDGNSLTIQLPYEIPEYPTAKGKPYQVVSIEPFEELSNYFSNSNLIIQSIVVSESNASDISCWPHHFDIASLITLDDTGDSETSTSIGIGMSPGDAGYNEPYYYLTPWPYPNVADLPVINGLGKWHTEGWVGGVFKASDLTNIADLVDQEVAVKEFLQQGLDTLKRLMD